MNMKQGDLLPSLSITCTSDGAVVDLTTATTVQVVAHREGEADALFTRSVDGTVNGVVTMDWQAGDTDTVGRINFEVLVTWPEGPQRFPATSYLPVDILPNLG